MNTVNLLREENNESCEEFIPVNRVNQILLVYLLTLIFIVNAKMNFFPLRCVDWQNDFILINKNRELE